MSSSAASAAVGRREPQPTGTKRGNYTALNLQTYKSSATGGGAGTKHYGMFVRLYPPLMHLCVYVCVRVCVCVCVCVCVGLDGWFFLLESG